MVQALSTFHFFHKVKHIKIVRSTKKLNLSNLRGLNSSSKRAIKSHFMLVKYSYTRGNQS